MLSWPEQIDAAKSPHEIVAITRDYLATWTPGEIGCLPVQCRPGRLKHEQDIEQLHVCLVEEYGRNRLTGDALSALQRMTSFVVRASVRIAQFRAEDEGFGQDDGAAPAPARPSEAARGR